jgi:hypothetical protein
MNDNKQKHYKNNLCEKRGAVVYLRQKIILRSTIECTYCAMTMAEIVKSNAGDGYVWKCQNKQCTKFKTTRSIRTKSFLENYNVDLCKFVSFLYFYSCETQQKDISRHTLIPIRTIKRLIQDIQEKNNFIF